MRLWRLLPLLGLWALAACVAPGRTGQDAARADFSPSYLGIETRLLGGDLVNFLVSMRGARDNTDLADYAECAAAQYALIRGYGYARHVRTNVQEEAGLWRADAVYTISPELPQGLATINATQAVAECAETGIPTV